MIIIIIIIIISSLLNKSGYGYNTPHGKISHLFYMDDLKTYTQKKTTNKRAC